MNEFNIEQVQKLRIHELRDYAKTLGVASPTTMNKNELLIKIKEVFEIGKPQPVIVTDEDDMDFFSLLTSEKSNIFNKLLDRVSKPERKNVNKYDSEKLDLSDLGSTPFSYAINQNEAEYSSETDVFGGYLDIHPEGYGIVRKNGFIPSEEDVYITESLVNKKGLKKGMYLKGKVKTIIVGKPKIMYQIDYNDYVVYKAKGDYDSLNYGRVGEELDLVNNKFKVKKGERLYCKGLSMDKVISIANELTEENSCFTKVINIKAKPEDNYKSNQKMEIIDLPFNINEVECLNAIELIVERVKREVEMGRPCVLFLNNFCDIVRTFNVAIEGFYDFSKLNAKAVSKIKNILYMAKHSGKNQYVSVVCVDKDGISADLKNIANYEFLPLFNRVNDK